VGLLLSRRFELGYRDRVDGGRFSYESVPHLKSKADRMGHQTPTRCAGCFIAGSQPAQTNWQQAVWLAVD